ncbi:MAG: type II secretion system F family protein [Tepidiformaceae bacterium]
MEVLATISAILAAFVLVYTLATPGRARQLVGRLERYDRSASVDREELLSRPFTERVGMPLLHRLQRGLSLLLPTTFVRAMEKRLLLAGEPMSVHAFFAWQLLQGAVGLAVALFGAATAPSAIGVGASIAVGAVLALFPIYWVYRAVAARKEAILKALPDVVDLIVTTVEAGLGIDAAIAEVGPQTAGPLGDELRITVREATLGRSRRDAFQRLIERTQVPELRTFVQSLIQAEQKGIPVGQVLRTQAAQIRVKRRQRAEVLAQRAPVKMVLVLVALVLPAMLLFVLGPAMIRILDTFDK